MGAEARLRLDHEHVLLCRCARAPPGEGLTALHSSTSQLNLSRSWSLKPTQASTNQFNRKDFADAASEHTPQKVSREAEK
jgi:hypothetical protein